jgi:phosphoribosylformylglycinamidine cyclo-ligase
MDPFKCAAQKAAATTDYLVGRFGFQIVPWTRGESVLLLETPWGYLAFVVEGLGTKNLVADAMYKLAREQGLLLGKTFYDHVAQCTVAMVVNDMITLGARPISYGQYLAVGHADWFSDEKRNSDLIEGTRKACELARCPWGPGETPTLKDIIIPGASDLSGAAIGWMPEKDRVFDPRKIREGDAIVAFESSGIHANGLTLARKIAEKLPEGYLTKLPDGRTYGETLLDPTHIYVAAIENCINAGVDIHYAVNVTGHGWRKLMRAPQPFAYVIDDMPWKPDIFDFIQKHGPVDDVEAYGNLNMGIGFVIYIPPKQLGLVVQALESLQWDRKTNYFLADIIGHVEKSDEKKVIITPKGIEFQGSTLAVR